MIHNFEIIPRSQFHTFLFDKYKEIYIKNNAPISFFQPYISYIYQSNDLPLKKEKKKEIDVTVRKNQHIEKPYSVAENYSCWMSPDSNRPNEQQQPMVMESFISHILLY